MKQLIGKVTHFYPNIKVAVVKLEKDIKVGDKISIEGHGNSFEQTIDSIQIDRKSLNSAKKGQEIGLKVDTVVKEKDEVYKL